ncbi:MAG: transposase [Acidobacteria bacterium]|nr:transposase [Acidobacteriota bacterium]
MRKRARLPHWDVEHGIYAVSWHLGDALPVAAHVRIREEIDAEIEFLRITRGDLTQAERTEFLKKAQRRLGAALDRSYGSCLLRSESLARIVATALEHFDAQRYELYAWCVMPNHVHVVFRSVHPHALADVVRGWKGYSAHEINKRLNRRGKLWEDDYFDTTMRNERHFLAAVEYTVSNPLKIGLTDWSFARSYPERIAEACGRPARQPPDVSSGGP